MPPAYGINDAAMPQTFSAQLVYPFRKRATTGDSQVRQPQAVPAAPNLAPLAQGAHE